MTDEEKLELRKRLYDEISVLYAEMQPDLSEAGVSDKKYQMPPWKDTYSLRRLTTVQRALAELVKSEALKIFKTARELQPAGTLKRWAGDELMREAREVKLYMSACAVLRQEWASQAALKSFFKRD